MKTLVAARGIGGAGTGKTTMMMEIAEKALHRPELAGNHLALGFSSFTRAARAEAAGRAGAAWGIDPLVLEKHGWFRTCHSVAYKQLGISSGEMIGSSKEDDIWVSEAIGSDVATTLDDSEEGGVKLYAGDPVAAAALNYWSLSRNLVVPLRPLVEADGEFAADEIIKRVAMYEQSKRLEGRSDFTDLLTRFVGLRFDPDGGPEFVAPEGAVPDEVVGWIFDEAQDASKLLDMACRRLVTGESCLWAWLVGDPFQVLYSWGGASSDHFMGWEVQKQKTMPKSYRCAAPILALGERCLQRLHRGYWDRGIAPADHDGEVIESDNFEDDLADLDPREETLVIARTNRHVRQAAAILDDIGMPFRKVKGKDGALARDIGMGGLWRLQHGQPINREEWGHAVDMLPQKTSDGRTWLVRGSKSKWSKGLKERYDRIWPEDLPDLGATAELRVAIETGTWGGLLDGGTKWVAGAKRWGVDVVAKPKIRIGTIHSVKGQEADKVVLISSVGKRVRESEDNSDERHDEERRVEYVAVTRARRKLVIAHDPRERNRMELPL